MKVKLFKISLTACALLFSTWALADTNACQNLAGSHWDGKFNSTNGPGTLSIWIQTVQGSDPTYQLSGTVQLNNRGITVRYTLAAKSACKVTTASGQSVVTLSFYMEEEDVKVISDSNISTPFSKFHATIQGQLLGIPPTSYGDVTLSE